MNEERISIFKELLNHPQFPIITENEILKSLVNPLVLDATVGREYFSDNPDWVKEINESNNHFLVIKNIDYINPIEQIKLVDLLKNRKVGLNKLKKDLYIVLTVDKLDFNYINDEIISLTVQV